MRSKPILFQRRTLWWPTWLGWFGILVMVVAPLVFWGLFGERFLSLNKKLDAEILIVECWIGVHGLTAAVDEFNEGEYNYIVTVGPKVKRGWESQGRTVAELAGGYLETLGVPREKIIVAPAADKDKNRTFESALSAMRKLSTENISSSAINVFTHGTHSRRSRLVFSKVFGGGTRVGCISWIPQKYKESGFWTSTERTESILTETFSYFFELILNGGREL